VHPPYWLVHRLFLNLSGRQQRVLSYRDVDVLTIDLVHEGGYVRPAKTESPLGRARTISIPAREGPAVHGISFVSNRILPSGQDGAHGHFVAAFGFEVSRFTESDGHCPA
jgi:hypothetical protein